MSRIKIDPILKTFKQGVDMSLSLASDAEHFKEPRGARGKDRPILKSRQYLIVELSFLQLFISWEQFLEQTFIRYMCGSKTSSGYSPKRFVQPPTLDQALEIVMQGKPYVDWTRLNEVIYKAKLYFENGDPFSNTLGSASAQLEEMKATRNRIAHRSKHSKKIFRSVVRQKIGHNPKGMGPGRFLLYRIPSTNPKTLLQDYADLLLALGRLIVR